jgi:hypothetical protein
MNKTVKIGKTQMLFDLNGDTTNFNIDFSITSSSPNKDFYVVVVDQNTLDDGSTFNFKNSTGGELSGNLVYNKNIYQNFFLCLKSDHDEHDVKIILNKKEISPSHQDDKPKQFEEKQNNINKKSPSCLSWLSCLYSWKILIIIFLACTAIAYLWFSKKSDKSTKNIDLDLPSSPTLSDLNSTFNSPSPSPSVYSSGSDSSYDSPVNFDIMSKLNNLKL